MFYFSFFCTFSLIFQFKLCSFRWWGHKNVSSPRAQGTLATLLVSAVHTVCQAHYTVECRPRLQKPGGLLCKLLRCLNVLTLFGRKLFWHCSNTTKALSSMFPKVVFHLLTNNPWKFVSWYSQVPQFLIYRGQPLKNGPKSGFWRCLM